MRQLLAGVSSGGGGSLDAFLNGLDSFWRTPPQRLAAPVLQSVAAILYDQECSGGHDQAAAEADFGDACSQIGTVDLNPITMALFERMLLVDYDIGVFPLSHDGILVPAWFSSDTYGTGSRSFAGS